METSEQSEHLSSRRSFLLKGAAVGAEAIGAGRLLADPSAAFRPTASPRETWRFSGSWLRPSSSRPICGSSTTSSAASRTAKSRAEAGTRPIPQAVAVLDEDMAQYIHDNTDDELSHVDLHQRLSGGERRGTGQPGQVPHPAQQQGDRRAADRPADQPDAADRRHQLLDALPQRLAEPRPRRHPAAGRPGPGRRASTRRFRAATTTSARQTTCRRSPTRPASTSLHRAGRHEPLRLARAAGHAPEVLRILLSIGGTEIDALPDLAGQGRQRAAPDRPHDRAGRSPTSTPTVS